MADIRYTKLDFKRDFIREISLFIVAFVSDLSNPLTFLRKYDIIIT